MFDPITLGAISAGVGALGGIFGMSRRTPKTSVPTLDMLRQQNPDLYEQLMGMQRQTRAFEQMAAARQGLTAAQQQGISDNTSQINQQLASRGMVGSSAGTALSADARSRMLNQALEQAMRERMSLMQAAQQGQQGYISAFGQAVNPMMQAQQANNQAKAQNNAAMNQFFSGLVGGGLNLMASPAQAASRVGGAMASTPDRWGQYSIGSNGFPSWYDPHIDRGMMASMPPTIDPREI